MLFAQRRSKLEGIRMERLWASQADDSGVRREGRDSTTTGEYRARRLRQKG